MKRTKPEISKISIGDSTDHIENNLLIARSFYPEKSLVDILEKDDVSAFPKSIIDMIQSVSKFLNSELAKEYSEYYSFFYHIVFNYIYGLRVTGYDNNISINKTLDILPNDIKNETKSLLKKVGESQNLSQLYLVSKFTFAAKYTVFTGPYYLLAGELSQLMNMESYPKLEKFIRTGSNGINRDNVHEHIFGLFDEFINFLYQSIDLLNLSEEQKKEYIYSGKYSFSNPEIVLNHFLKLVKDKIFYLGIRDINYEGYEDRIKKFMRK